VARLLLSLLLACLLQGCFVFEELDKGEALMDAHRPKKPEAAKSSAPVARAGKEEPGPLAGLSQSLQDWWKAKSEPAAPQRDPADVPVRCEIDGRMSFTRRSDCQLRGGSIL